MNINEWKLFKTTVDKIDAIVSDMNNCTADVTRAILESAVKKMVGTLNINKVIEQQD